eukprot:TRINITY_DN55409_c0_g1_i2.p1 TRINITY_DN55409_c0_g1~~TRINITY_DN55409_c0_g1_i2.p1  ORF type:complete len:635 (+),score=62.75 TRINITY_DN55409_c0_g1_i2:77-1981(+)
MVSLQWENLQVQVQVKGGPPWKPKKTKSILKGVSGHVQAGQLCAIMGPSGSGKTTLLDTLSGRRRFGGGTIMVNGKSGVDVKTLAGYVVQDDILSGWLTVRENLQFSADLRLPDSEKPDAVQHVKRVLDEVGLTRVQHQKIGNELIRGVSGGERKRANIGMELIRRPQLLFLDEPTTGLDSTTATSIVHLLQQLTRTGKTVILAIHQPKARIFKMFDHLILLDNGNVIFQGPPLNAVGYFSQIGFTLADKMENPSDFVMDVVMHCHLDDASKPHSEKIANTEKSPILQSTEGDSKADTFDIEHGTWPPAGQTDLADVYNKSGMNLEVNAALTKAKDSASSRLAENSELQGSQFNSSMMREIWVLSKRNVLSLVRNPMVTVLQVLVMVFFAVIVGLIYFKLDKTTTGLQNRVGAIFFIIMNMVFGNMGAVEIFLKERTVFIHERSSSYYRVFSYLVAKIFMDVVPLRIIPTGMFVIVVYYMVGFRNTIYNFLAFITGLILTSLSSASICFMVSSGVSVFAIGNLLVSLFYVFFMVFGGLMINISSIPVYFRWLEKISIFRYAYASLCISELHDIGTFECPNPPPPGCMPVTGNDFLASQDFNPDMLWWNYLILGGMTLGYFLLSYVVLLLQTRLK